MVSISPTTAPEALSRLISPARPDWFCTVKVCVPVPADAQSGAHDVRVTVTVALAVDPAAGSAAMATPAATAGTVTSTVATVHGLRPASRSHRRAPELPGLAATGLAATGAVAGVAAAAGAGALPGRPAR